MTQFFDGPIGGTDDDGGPPVAITCPCGQTHYSRMGNFCPTCSTRIAAEYRDSVSAAETEAVRVLAAGTPVADDAVVDRDDDGDPVTARRLCRRGYRVLRLGDTYVVLTGDGKQVLFSREAK